jgi:hypothetical protein
VQLDPGTVGLLLDQWRRDPEGFVLDWLVAEADKRSGSVHLAPTPEGDLTGGDDEGAAQRGRIRPPMVPPETPTLAAKTAGLPAVGHCSEATGYSVWVGFRDVPVAAPTPVAVTGEAMPATHPGSVPSAPRPLPDGPADSIVQLLPEAADFLCPVFPFDASALRDQVARFRDLLEPAVPVIEQCFMADEWWVGAAAVGVSAGAVVWFRRSAVRARWGEHPAAGDRDRPDDVPDGSRKILPARPPRRSPEVAEVGGEGALAAWDVGPG